MPKFFAPALLALSLLPTAASAQSQDVAVRIEYRDLNLASPDGVKRLDRRIAKAVTDLCPNDRAGNLSASLVVRRCRAAKIAQIAPQRQRVLAGGLAQPVRVAAY